MRISEYNEALSKTIAALDEANLILVQDASELLNTYWEQARMKEKFIPYGINVQKQSEASYRIRWVHFYKVKNVSGIDGGVKTRHINKGKSDAYSIHQFKGCPAWFEVLFHEYEPQLAEIRKAIRINRAIRGRLKKLITENGKKITD